MTKHECSNLELVKEFPPHIGIPNSFFPVRYNKFMRCPTCGQLWLTMRVDGKMYMVKVYEE